MYNRRIRSVLSVSAAAVLAAVGCGDPSDGTVGSSAGRETEETLPLRHVNPEVEDLVFRIREELHFSRQEDGADFLAGVYVELRRVAGREDVAVVAGEVLNKPDLLAIAVIALREAQQGGKLAWDLRYPDGRIHGFSDEVAIRDYLEADWSRETPTGWVE